MADANVVILRDAIARNAGAVLSLPSAGMLRHHKSRFLADSSAGADGAGGDAGFWIESAPGEAALIDSLIVTRQHAGLSFKNGHLKVVFGTQLLRRQSGYRINADTQVEAVLLAFPAEIKAIQRRNNYRVRIPGDGEIMARVWRIANHAYLRDRPLAAQEVDCEIRDLSTGGVGVMFRGKDGEPAKVSTEDRLRIEISRGTNKLLLEGRMRYPVAPNKEKQFRAGIQFKALENNLVGRQLLAQLTRIVGELQREEVRRIRLGLCKAG